jgi:hypothetical protein
MPTKKPPGSDDRVDPDDAPRLSADMLVNAEVFDGDSFIRRGRGRPGPGRAGEAARGGARLAVADQRAAAARAWDQGKGASARGLTVLRAALIALTRRPKQAK